VGATRGVMSARRLYDAFSSGTILPTGVGGAIAQNFLASASGKRHRLTGRDRVRNNFRLIESEVQERLKP